MDKEKVHYHISSNKINFSTNECYYNLKLFSLM